MGTSLYCYRPRLYRKLARAVTLGCICAVLVGASFFYLANAQFAKKRKPDTGPRAVGLLKIDAKDRAHLVPVVIRIHCKFYAAGAYKADPLPLPFQPHPVYQP